MRRIVLLACVFFWGCLEGAEYKEGVVKGPSILYLTWTGDPTTTMTVQWHSGKEAMTSLIFYREEGDETWRQEKGIYAPLGKGERLVHTVELRGLKPGTRYQFEVGGREGRVYAFKTLPATLSEPVRFVVGGDAYFYEKTFRKMNAQVAAQDPDFIVVGGDIAYTNNSRAVFKGQGWELSRWRRFLKMWTEQMVTSDGRLIPLIPVIGNHDIKQISLEMPHRYFLFYELFALPEKGVSYRTLDAGDYLSLFLLDTGHSYHIEGQQTQWLEGALAQREERPYKMGVYHIGAYPSVYPFGGNVPKKIRACWCPLFDRYQLQVAFEHHNHAYKRSFPLKQGQIDPQGVLYLGDGSWGVSARKPKELWYLEKTAQANTVHLVSLTADQGTIEAIDLKGQQIDQVGIKPSSVPSGSGALSSGR